MLWTHASPEQQLVSPVPVHGVPSGLHAAVHLSVLLSFGSGVHGSPLQHWSENWQTWPWSMQHGGGLFAP